MSEITDGFAVALPPRTGTTRHNGRVRHARPAPAIRPDRLKDRPARDDALNRALLTVDIVGFGGRDIEAQEFVRDAMYRMLREAFDDSSISWEDCYREDRGDGVLIVVSPDISTTALINPLIDNLYGRLRFHNRMSSRLARIELRLALHVGHIRKDANGVVGPAIVHVYRLLESQSFKDELRLNAATLGLVVSNHVYEELIRDGGWLIDPEAYRPIEIETKETRAEAWLNLRPSTFWPN